ncbi:iron chaperone [Streptomyces sp. NPDC002573]|uniref:iron chaperone n=1 Tax=Streptomyces sp. NPDC002573 TaxID=3364651 RepID=UPI0036A308E6
MQPTKSSAENSGASTEQYNGFTAEERAAMKEHAQEQKKAAAQRGSRAEKEVAAERDVLAKIAEMPEADRVLAERIHDIIKTAAPDLAPKLWYGMPAYARNGKVVCHFQSAEKFKSRYATLGFSDQAALDDGAMWPTAYALKGLTPADEQRIIALVKKAVG